MSSQFPFAPDPMPLREALRGLRFLLRRGRETLVDTMGIQDLPKPAADLVGKALREVDDLAQGVEKIASGLAKTVLGSRASEPMTLNDLGDDAQFGASVYAALRSVLRHLRAPGVFVSEAAARRAYRLGDTTDAAALTINLLDTRVVRGTTTHESSFVPGASLENVSIFAVLLWLQSTRSEDENEDALNAATDLAVALAPQIEAACVARDHARIAALYAQYAAHV